MPILDGWRDGLGFVLGQSTGDPGSGSAIGTGAEEHHKILWIHKFTDSNRVHAATGVGMPDWNAVPWRHLKSNARPLSLAAARGEC